MKFSNAVQPFMLDSLSRTSAGIIPEESVTPDTAQFSMHRVSTQPLRSPSDGQKLRKSETWQDLVGLLLMQSSLKDTMDNMNELLELCQTSSEGLELQRFVCLSRAHGSGLAHALE
jgi:hypothetical protein